MTINKKWVVRIASLILVAGFFLPFVSVSCIGIPGGAISLSEMAQYFEQAQLYFTLLAYFALGLLAFVPAGDENQKKALLWVQLGSLGFGFLVLIGTYINLSSKNGTGMIEITPNIGILVTIGGYILALWGLVTDQSVETQPIHHENIKTYREPFEKDPLLVGSVPHLDLIRGAPPQPPKPLHDQFTIGRSSDSNLILNDPAVSRRHAVIRHAQGAWFIQDQNSRGGTWINGQRTPAARLENGDNIQIGGSILVFRKD